MIQLTYYILIVWILSFNIISAFPTRYMYYSKSDVITLQVNLALSPSQARLLPQSNLERTTIDNEILCRSRNLPSMQLFGMTRNQLSLTTGIAVFLLSSVHANAAITYLPTTIDDNSKPLTTRQVIIRKTENFLTNPVLEGIRKIDQLDPDTDMKTSNKVILLIPIVDILHDLETILQNLRSFRESPKSEKPLAESLTILDNEAKYDKVIFKKIFNRYSDNIYYSDPERANLYLAGGAMPGTIQTEQYLYRNEALTSIENVKEDIRLLMQGKLADQNNADLQAIDDTIDDCSEAIEALNSYLKLTDPEVVQSAKKIVFK